MNLQKEIEGLLEDYERRLENLPDKMRDYSRKYVASLIIYAVREKIEAMFKEGAYHIIKDGAVVWPESE